MRLTKNGKTNQIGPVMERYIIDFLLDRQQKKCADCGEELKTYQVHHKRYGLDINVYDLCLLCGDCHAKHRGYKRTTGPLRTINVA